MPSPGARLPRPFARRLHGLCPPVYSRTLLPKLPDIVPLALRRIPPGSPSPLLPPRGASSIPQSPLSDRVSSLSSSVSSPRPALHLALRSRSSFFVARVVSRCRKVHWRKFCGEYRCVMRRFRLAGPSRSSLAPCPSFFRDLSPSASIAE